MRSGSNDPGKSRVRDARRRSLGERLKIARELAGLTLGQAAKRLCLDRYRLYQWEHRGKSVVPLSLERAAEVYGVRLPWLRAEREPVSPEMARFAQKLRQGSPYSQWKMEQHLLALHGPMTPEFWAGPCGGSTTAESSCTSPTATPHARRAGR